MGHGHERYAITCALSCVYPVPLSTGESKNVVTIVATEDIHGTEDSPVELWCTYGAYYWKNGKMWTTVFLDILTVLIVTDQQTAEERDESTDDDGIAVSADDESDVQEEEVEGTVEGKVEGEAEVTRRGKRGRTVSDGKAQDPKRKKSSRGKGSSSKRNTRRSKRTVGDEDNDGGN